MRRPKTLVEVASWSTSAEEFSMNVADFLHQFKLHRSAGAVCDEPELLASRFELGPVADAYLAAIAAALANQIQHSAPAWTRKPERFRREPWFASPGPDMRACLLLESPGPFRERNLFVTANALDVA